MQPTEKDRLRFASLADRLLPQWRNMPAASAVRVHRDMLDLILEVRPDLIEDFFRGVRGSGEGDPSEAINMLYRNDHAAFNAVNLVAVAAYYMTDEVRAIIGYPGQENAPYNPQETPAYLMDGTLERVVRRGSLYRSTPQG